MKLPFALAAAAALVAGPGFGVTPASAMATCPTIGGVNDCNKIITINSNGSVTITTPDSSGYGSGANELVGVVNDAGTQLNQFDISGTGLFQFDGNGVQTILAGSGGLPDTTGYGGKTSNGSNTYFINYTADSGTIVLGGGVDPGGTAYFSLAGSPSVSFTVGNIVLSEPAGIAILGTGVFGLLVTNRRRPADGSRAHRVKMQLLQLTKLSSDTRDRVCGETTVPPVESNLLPSGTIG